MGKTNLFKRIIASIIVITMLITIDSLPVNAFASEADTAETIIQSNVNGGDDIELSTGYIDIGHVAAKLEDDESFGQGLDSAGEVPSSYSSVTKGYVTSVKNQSAWGTCWAFAATAAMESYVLAHGYENNKDEVDFCEYSTAYFTYKDSHYFNQTGDYTWPSDLRACFMKGGNDEYAFKTLTKGLGVYNEIDSYYSDSLSSYYNSTLELPVFDISTATSEYILTGQYYINIEDTDAVKAAIMEHGAATISYFSDDAYEADNKKTYNYNYEKSSTNHAVTLVGWDDNKSKDLFTVTDTNGVTHTPNNNGAWLIKNSWGTYWGESGYCWISYEDYGVLSSDVVVYEVTPRVGQDNIYQYDGATVYWWGPSGYKFANVFTIEGYEEQLINSISFANLGTTNNPYTVNIYRNSTGKTLNAGALVASKSGTTTFEGYYTVVLDEPIFATVGETYTVEVIFEKQTQIIACYYEYPLVNGYAYTYGETHTGESFIQNSSGEYTDMMNTYWYSYNGFTNLCIKMFTADKTNIPVVPQITDVSMTAKNIATIEWQKSNDATGYQLWIGTSEDDANPTIVQADTNSYKHTVEIGTTYYYKVSASYTDDSSQTVYTDYSTVKIYTAELPSPNLTVALDLTTVNLSWSKIDFVDGYRIYRSKDEGQFELLIDIDATDNLFSYSDADLVFGSTYKYYIISYMNGDNGTEYTSSDIEYKTVEVIVPVVSNVDIDDRFYGKITLSWNDTSGLADGYIINVYISGDDSFDYFTKYTTIYLEDGSLSSYELDTTGFEQNYYVTYSIASYIDVGNTSAHSDFVYCEFMGYAGDPAIEVDVKWNVVNNHLMIYVSEENEIGYYGFYYADDYSEYYPDEFFLVEKEEGSNTAVYESEYIPYNSSGYLFIRDYYLYHSFNDEPYIVGGAYAAPQLEVIENVSGAIAGQEITFTANITNKMENFKYSYQWYQANTATGNGVAISGATSETYAFSVGAYEYKYIYCVVTAEYNGTNTYSTANSSGEHTLITGEKFGQDVQVEAIADQRYTGKEIVPKLNITSGDFSLTEGVDYTVSIANNINEGTASVTITYTGLYASLGIVNTSFEIVRMTPEEITSSDVSVNQDSNMISKITIGTTVGELMNCINENAYISIRKDGQQVSDGTALGTGMKVSIMEGDVSVRDYEIVVTGDTNGDGKINITDMIAVKAAVLGKSNLSGVYAKAGDTNGDGKINITDFIKTKAHILGKDKIIGMIAK